MDSVVNVISDIMLYLSIYVISSVPSIFLTNYLVENLKLSEKSIERKLMKALSILPVVNSIYAALVLFISAIVYMGDLSYMTISESLNIDKDSKWSIVLQILSYTPGPNIIMFAIFLILCLYIIIKKYINS